METGTETETETETETLGVNLLHLAISELFHYFFIKTRPDAKAFEYNFRLKFFVNQLLVLKQRVTVTE